MRYLSPLRYPGGKGELSPFLVDVIDLCDLRGCSYYEPFAGGAGAALRLLRDGVVSNVFINDADFRIYAFWKAVLEQPDQFINCIENVPLNIEEWKRQNKICSSENIEAESFFEVGFSTFYMNRCNRSGVLFGAGPIGGYAQSGKWKLDARFNRAELIKRVIELTQLKDSIIITGLDALCFLKRHLPRGAARRHVFVYLDPPYVVKGDRLYLNSYSSIDHRKLATYIQGQRQIFWLLSYDDTTFVRKLYNSCQIRALPVNYALNVKRRAQELLVAPYRTSLPNVWRYQGKTERANSAS